MHKRRITPLNYFGDRLLIAVAVLILTAGGLMLAHGQGKPKTVMVPCTCTTDTDCMKRCGGDGSPPKRGTPCKHRVKAKGARCKQHAQAL